MNNFSEDLESRIDRDFNLFSKIGIDKNFIGWTLYWEGYIDSKRDDKIISKAYANELMEHVGTLVGQPAI